MFSLVHLRPAEQTFNRLSRGDWAPKGAGASFAQQPAAVLIHTMPDSCPVLVVEDDANALSGYLEFLSAAGVEPTGISNGAEALPLALRNPPAAVITDITLPGMSGFDLAAALRCDVRTRNVPIIGLTAHWTPDVRAR